MSNPSRTQDSRSEPETTGESRRIPNSASLKKASVPKAGAGEPPKKLTPEEQMDLYEKDLKENDWGHRPC